MRRTLGAAKVLLAALLPEPPVTPGTSESFRADDVAAESYSPLSLLQTT